MIVNVLIEIVEYHKTTHPHELGDNPFLSRISLNGGLLVKTLTEFSAIASKPEIHLDLNVAIKGIAITFDPNVPGDCVRIIHRNKDGQECIGDQLLWRGAGD